MSLRFSCKDAVSSHDDFFMESLPITIGRGEDADICINDNWASRHNCQLVEQEGELWVVDLQSSNGTRLNGNPVSRHALTSGDELTIGITTFRITFNRLPTSRNVGQEILAAAD